MEPLIAVLAPHVIDQIAAGEVIERPASVVKELVDNAIDAGATTITVEVTGGGRSLVRVYDDGCGMSAKAAVLALERHATSKLRQVDDLWGISSMGFRGEALPSIASVARMTLTTRRAGDDAATRIAIDTGRLISVTDAGAPVGTTVEVTDLLHNLPARLKFLKGEATEASHVTELVAKVAMAYPRLHVKLKHNGRTALDVPPDRDGLARAQALLGPRIAARLIHVTGEESGVRVTAYLGAPELAQATARGVQLFVGRRPVRDRGLLHALAMGYGELIPRGRYPIAVVLVDVPAGAVDVNVHPQKLEVRFSDAAAVAAAVRHVVQAGVSSARWRDEAGGAGPVQMLASVAPPTLPFDGHAATQLSERHVAQMKSRQVPLGFAAPVASTAAAWGSAGSAAAVRSASSASAARGMASSSGGSAGSPRDWARNLRDQTRASRAEEPRSVYRTGGGGPSQDLRADEPPRSAEPPAYSEGTRDLEPVSASSPPLLCDPALGPTQGPTLGPIQGPTPGPTQEPPPSPTQEPPPGPTQEPPPSPTQEPPPSATQKPPPNATQKPTPSATQGLTPSPMQGSTPGATQGATSSPTQSLTPSATQGPRSSPMQGPTHGLPQRPTLGSTQEPTLDPTRGVPLAAASDGSLPGSPVEPDSSVEPGVCIEPGAPVESTELAELADPARSGRRARVAEGSGPVAAHGFFSQLRFLGQLDLTYLVCESDGEMVLVDQHAAHERVELARLRDRHAGGAGSPRVAVQNMLFPVTLDATPSQLALVARVGDLLSQVGFEVEPFGKATLAVKAVPAGIRHGDPAQLLRSLLHEWTEVGAPSEADRLDALLGEIACHSVVRAGDRLTPSEVETLLRSLDGVDLSLPAPHGRAVLLRLPLTELGRRFGR